jgi:hypothetical protein
MSRGFFVKLLSGCDLNSRLVSKDYVWKSSHIKVFPCQPRESNVAGFVLFRIKGNAR